MAEAAGVSRYQAHSAYALKRLVIDIPFTLFQTSGPEQQFKFNVAMSCSGCSGAVERALKKQEGTKQSITKGAGFIARTNQSLRLNLFQASPKSIFPSKLKLSWSLPLLQPPSMLSERKSPRPAKLSTVVKSYLLEYLLSRFQKNKRKQILGGTLNPYREHDR
jgi:hypothetical protein